MSHLHWSQTLLLCCLEVCGFNNIMVDFTAIVYIPPPQLVDSDIKENKCAACILDQISLNLSLTSVMFNRVGFHDNQEADDCLRGCGCCVWMLEWFDLFRARVLRNHFISGGSLCTSCPQHIWLQKHRMFTVLQQPFICVKSTLVEVMAVRLL